MKLFKLNKIIATIAFGVGLTTCPVIASASNDRYQCKEANGVYGVYSRVSKGYVRLMEIDRNISAEWSISNRCEEIAMRLQRYHDNDMFKDFHPGNINNHPVLCAAIAEADTQCSSNNLIVTLPPNVDPVLYARQLMDTRGLARGRKISVSGSGRIEVTTENGDTYFNIEALEQAVLEKEESDRFIPFDN